MAGESIEEIRARLKWRAGDQEDRLAVYQEIPTIKLDDNDPDQVGVSVTEFLNTVEAQEAETAARADQAVHDFRKRLNEIADGEIAPAQTGAEAFGEAIAKAAEALVENGEFRKVCDLKHTK